MKRHWKKIVGVLVVVVALVVGGSWFYAKVINKAPAKRSTSDLADALDKPVPAGDAGPSTTAANSPPRAANDLTGVWRAVSTSLIRYRVDETINGFASTAVGGTNKVTGSVTIEGKQVRAAGFTVDTSSFTSDESRRDQQFRGRVMEVSKFPTATFDISSPIEFASVPADGKTVQLAATGDLTLHGAKKPVTFDLVAMRKNGKIGVLGTIPIVFADYGIPNPSFATVSTKDHGELEFIIVLQQS